MLSPINTELVKARRSRHWTQKDLAKRLGMVQAHISEIETGKVSPRYDTLLNLVRALDYDLVLVPRTLVPAVNAILHPSEDDQPLYASEREEESSEG